MNDDENKKREAMESQQYKVPNSAVKGYFNHDKEKHATQQEFFQPEQAEHCDLDGRS